MNCTNLSAKDWYIVSILHLFSRIVIGGLVNLVSSKALIYYIPILVFMSVPFHFIECIYFLIIIIKYILSKACFLCSASIHAPKLSPVWSSFNIQNYNSAAHLLFSCGFNNIIFSNCLEYFIWNKNIASFGKAVTQ